MRTYTLSELISMIRRRADMENSQFVTDSEITDYLNESIAELDDILTQKFQDYRLTNRIMALSPTQSFYNLPEDFFKLLGVDADVNQNFSQAYTLRPFEFPVRNRFNLLPVSAGFLGGLLDLRYRILGDTISLIPEPQSALYLRIWYYPASKKLDSTTRTFTDAEVSASADTISFASHGYSVGDRIAFSNIGGSLPTPLVAATDYYTIPTSKNVFQLASSRDNAFKGIFFDITSAAGGGTNTIDDDRGIYDGQNGWEEYVVCDVAGKLLEKEESDSSAMTARKAALLSRIMQVAENRDAGMPAKIIDVAMVNGVRGGFFS